MFCRACPVFFLRKTVKIACPMFTNACPMFINVFPMFIHVNVPCFAVELAIFGKFRDFEFLRFLRFLGRFLRFFAFFEICLHFSDFRGSFVPCFAVICPMFCRNLGLSHVLP